MSKSLLINVFFEDNGIFSKSISRTVILWHCVYYLIMQVYISDSLVTFFNVLTISKALRCTSLTIAMPLFNMIVYSYWITFITYHQIIQRVIHVKSRECMYINYN